MRAPPTPTPMPTPRATAFLLEEELVVTVYGWYGGAGAPATLVNAAWAAVPVATVGEDAVTAVTDTTLGRRLFRLVVNEAGGAVMLLVAVVVESNSSGSVSSGGPIKIT